MVNKTVISFFLAGLGVLALAVYTIIQSQAGHHPLILPAQWMSWVLGTLSVFFGMGWTLGGAVCITLVYAAVFVVATIAVFILPPFFGMIRSEVSGQGVWPEFQQAPRWKQLVCISFICFGVALIAALWWLLGFLLTVPAAIVTIGTGMLSGTFLLLIGLHLKVGDSQPI